jgi:excisionase family DNA binding protein
MKTRTKPITRRQRIQATALPAGASSADRLFTTKEIATLASVSKDTVDDWRFRHGLRVVKLGRGSIRIRETDWQGFLKKNTGHGLRGNGYPRKRIARSQGKARA